MTKKKKKETEEDKFSVDVSPAQLKMLYDDLLKSTSEENEKFKKLENMIMFRDDLVIKERAKIELLEGELFIQKNTNRSLAERVRNVERNWASEQKKSKKLEKELGASRKKNQEIAKWHNERQTEAENLKKVNKRLSSKIQELQVGSDDSILTDFKNQDRELKK